MTELLMVGTSIYTMVAIRVAFVIVRARTAGGLSPDRFYAAVAGFLWPVFVIMVGLIVLLTGQTGVFARRSDNDHG